MYIIHNKIWKNMHGEYAEVKCFWHEVDQTDRFEIDNAY